VGVAERPLAGERRSGDLAVFVPLPDGALVVAIDGLGHGDAAADASAAAAEVLRDGAAAEPGALLARCHTALTGTRGAVMTLAWFDLAAGRLIWTGVGNVDGRLVRSGAGPRTPTEGPFVRGGVVGHQLPTVRATTSELRAGDLVVLATDGIASTYADALATGGPAQAIAERILREHAKPADDALVVVVRHRPAP
jgi:negative regulator of sigma-B (phosphoserine phosphatase)